jgi:hypothetical protein
MCQCNACPEEGGKRGATCLCFEELCPNCGNCLYHCDCDEGDFDDSELSCRKDHKWELRQVCFKQSRSIHHI